MAVLEVQQSTFEGIEPIFVAVDEEGDTFVNDGRTFLYFKNADTTNPRTVTITRVDCNQGFEHPVEVVIDEEEDRVVGKFLTRMFNTSNDSVVLEYDDHTDLTVAVVSIK